MIWLFCPVPCPSPTATVTDLLGLLIPKDGLGLEDPGGWMWRTPPPEGLHLSHTTVLLVDLLCCCMSMTKKRGLALGAFKAPLSK